MSLPLGHRGSSLSETGLQNKTQTAGFLHSSNPDFKLRLFTNFPTLQDFLPFWVSTTHSVQQEHHLFSQNSHEQKIRQSTEERLPCR